MKKIKGKNNELLLEEKKKSLCKKTGLNDKFSFVDPTM
jgi:hypothetical protein